MLKVSDVNGVDKSFNLLVRNKPHGIQVRISHYLVKYLFSVYDINNFIYLATDKTARYPSSNNT